MFAFQGNPGNMEPALPHFHNGPITGISACVRKPIVATCGVDRKVCVWNYSLRSVEDYGFHNPCGEEPLDDHHISILLVHWLIRRPIACLSKLFLNLTPYFVTIGMRLRILHAWYSSCSVVHMHTLCIPIRH